MSDRNSALRTVRLVLVCAERNHNKFWNAWLFPHLVYVEYGRVGYAPRPHHYHYANKTAARNKFENLLNQKLTKGYRDAPDNPTQLEALDWGIFGDRAEVFAERFEFVVEIARKIERAWHLQFDSRRGVFQSSLGQFSLSKSRTARQSLNRVRQNYQVPNSNSLKFAVENYLSIIPMKVGMHLEIPKLFPTLESINEQFHLLDEIELALDILAEIRQNLRESPHANRTSWIDWENPEIYSSPTPVTDDRQILF